jgi:hypothetical protein
MRVNGSVRLSTLVDAVLSAKRVKEKYFRLSQMMRSQKSRGGGVAVSSVRRGLLCVRR